MGVDVSHGALADRLRARVLESGRAPADVRDGAFALGGGAKSALSSPMCDLARMVGTASSRVTDAMVADVRAALGSDVATFEVVMSASVGAGLSRWDAAFRVIGEAAGEAS